MEELILRHLKGETSPEEDRELESWRRASPENDRAFREVLQLWGYRDVLRARLDADRIPGAAELLERSGRRGEPSPSSPSRAGRHERKRRHAWARRLKVGALAAAFGAVTFGLGYLADLGTGPADRLAGSEIVTGSDEMTTVKLADGSSIRVGPSSHLRLSRDGHDRVAWLEGRAFFGVRPDPTRTFTVRTDRGEARVLGTRFEVRYEEEEFRVLVVEGTVRVRAGESEAEVGEGQLGRTPPGGFLTTTDVDNVFQHLTWMGNALVFNSTPLAKAFEEIDERYRVETTIADPALGDMTVTATFTDQDLEHVVVVVCEAVGARCAVDEGRVRVEAGSDAPTDANER